MHAEDPVASVAALADGVRRSLYDYVVSSPDAVGRDEAATAVGIKRPLAAFHLDKLVEQGLLEVEFRRLTGRSGPGAGRPSKLYRRSPTQFAVSLPPREYDLAAQILAEAVVRSTKPGKRAADVVVEIARDRGEQLAAQASADGATLIDTLNGHGFEARREGSEVVLGNCPFHPLAQEYTELVCGMNLALCTGLVTGLADPADHEAVLDPAPGRCCVVFRPT